MLSRFISNSLNININYFFYILINIIFFTLLIFITIFLKKIVWNLLIKQIFKKINSEENKKTATIEKLLKSIYKYSFCFVYFIIFITVFDFNFVFFISTFGFIGITITIFFQDLIKDIVSGFFIISENLYNVGDVISISGIKGEVINITIRTTKIKHNTGEISYICNREITKVTNFYSK